MFPPRPAQSHLPRPRLAAAAQPDTGPTDPLDLSEARIEELRQQVPNLPQFCVLDLTPRDASRTSAFGRKVNFMTCRGGRVEKAMQDPYVPPKATPRKSSFLDEEKATGGKLSVLPEPAPMSPEKLERRRR